MNKKIIIAGIIAIVAVFGVILVNASDNPSNADANVTKLNVSSEGPVKLSEAIKEIKSEEWYEGYDNKTVEWMESLGDKYVWHYNGQLVIMDKVDSDKIPSIYACDVDYWELFSCNVLENRSLGNVEYHTDVLLVENVEYLGENVHYYEV